ncbi:NADH dehydrogenase subunit I [Syntrophus gentianae]|uniref:NADH-quinone oxidoreductase subunit I n=1 Tax=Syntrophus gentianae TaxID=43775 RepID=A0A1H7ZLM7_9BACT|nr:NADH-quinone oxidoreductase subunit NuoI [Syntrophus gentianae]SEM58357.1 NADH dehydrogenase subunit I [Syntrophus gentianae]
MIKALAKGMALTFKTLFRPRITLRYPEEKRVMYERWRGCPYLPTGEDGRELCVACGICAKGCPAQAIRVEGGKREDNSRYPVIFEVDLGRCIFCGFCAESCPKNAIRLGQAYELATEDREKLVLTKEDLLHQGEKETT